MLDVTPSTKTQLPWQRADEIFVNNPVSDTDITESYSPLF